MTVPVLAAGTAGFFFKNDIKNTFMKNFDLNFASAFNKSNNSVFSKPGF